jgi:adenylate kinase
MIILMGVAGSGKSIQGRLFADELGYAWISTGELFRALVIGDRRKQMLAGKLLKDNEVIDLVDLTFSRMDLSQELVLDGFPRTEAQAEWLMEQIASSRLKLTAIFNLTASKEVVKERLLARGRRDDTESVISERFKEYYTKTLPMVNYFREQGVTVYNIDADQTPTEVNSSMLDLIASSNS